VKRLPFFLTVYPGQANYLRDFADRHNDFIEKNNPEELMKHCKYFLPLLLCAAFIQASRVPVLFGGAGQCLQHSGED